MKDQAADNTTPEAQQREAELQRLIELVNQRLEHKRRIRESLYLRILATAKYDLRYLQ